jgi:sporulation protein YlmC with PRC-barrel domain
MVSRLTEMNGAAVFTEEGIHVGELEDISIDPETGRVLGLMLTKLSDEFLKKMGAEAGKGIIVPYEAVKAVGDIILMRSVRYGAPKSEEL